MYFSFFRRIEYLINKFIKNGICDGFYVMDRWTDLPPIFQFSMKKEINRSNYIVGVGSSLRNEKIAVERAVGEFVERFSLRFFNKKEIKKIQYSRIDNNSIKLKQIVNFSKEQLKDKKIKQKLGTEKDFFLFTTGFNLLNNKKIFIPAQLVYVPFNGFKEKIIRLPISTGAAASFSFKKAIIKGILEVIERDAFMIYFLNKEFGYLINIEENKYLRQIHNFIKKYNLEIYTFFLPTDIKVYNILTIIIDKSGFAPAVNCGVDSDINLDKAILKSIEEALQVFSWIRFSMYFDKNNKKNDLYDIKQRGYYWSDINKIPLIMKWIKNTKNVIQYSKLKKYLFNFSAKILVDDDYCLDYLIKEIKRLNVNIYYKDITHPIFKKYRFKVAKVIIPELQPLYLNESFKYLGGERIYNILYNLGFKKRPTRYNELNKYPHFFL